MAFPFLTSWIFGSLYHTPEGCTSEILARQSMHMEHMHIDIIISIATHASFFMAPLLFSDI